MANTFTSMPFIPYKIIGELIYNENLFKLIYYDTYDCLSKPNVPIGKKSDLIWQHNKNMEDCNIFLTNTKSDIMTDSKTILQLYRYSTVPKNLYISTSCYRFDVLFGSKLAMVEYMGVPCNRGDLIEMEIMKSLNDKDIAGAGNLRYDRERSNLCKSEVGIGNNNTFTGISFVMATIVGDNNGDC